MSTSRKKAKVALPTPQETPLTSPVKEITRYDAQIARDASNTPELPATTHSDHVAIEHLMKVDPILAPIVQLSLHSDISPPCSILDPRDPELCFFRSIVKSIIYQQLAGKAAAAILRKFIALFQEQKTGQKRGLAAVQEDWDEGKGPDFFPTPQQVVEMDMDTLLSAGLSKNKAKFIKGVAEAFHGGSLSTPSLLKADMDEFTDLLLPLLGLGPWTVDMLAMFHRRELDILPVGDLGVRKGIAMLYNLKSEKDVVKRKQEVKDIIKQHKLSSELPPVKHHPKKKTQESLKATRSKDGWWLPSPQDMRALTQHWAPYRSVGSFYMWRVAETEIMKTK